MGNTDIRVALPDRRAALAPVFRRAFVNEPMLLRPMGEGGDLVEHLIGPWVGMAISSMTTPGS